MISEEELTKLSDQLQAKSIEGGEVVASSNSILSDALRMAFRNAVQELDCALES